MIPFPGIWLEIHRYSSKCADTIDFTFYSNKRVNRRFQCHCIISLSSKCLSGFIMGGDSLFYCGKLRVILSLLVFECHLMNSDCY